MKIKSIVLFVFLLLFISSTYAVTLKEVVRGTIISNPKIQSLRINSKAYRLYVDEEYGKLYPSLDLESYFEDATTKSKGSSSSKSGSNTQLQLEQTLFDGFLTNSKINEANYNYKTTKIKNIATVENVILESINAYLDVVKNRELILLSENNLLIHSDYLEVAMQSESVSGDTLERMQVESKMFSANAKFSETKRSETEAKAILEKFYGKKVNNDFCRPVVKTQKFENLEKIISEALVSNYTILEEIENIKTQRAIISQEKSRFYPTLKFKVIHEIDDGADIKDVKKTEDSFRLSLTYNIFNGFQDKAILQREKLFLKESQKNLDDVVNTVIQEVKINHTNYQTAKKRIDYLKNYLEKNKEILFVYLEQFEGGTRSFVDILNHEAELFRAKTDLTEEQFKYTVAYYELLNLVSKLSPTVLSSQKQICEEIKVDIERRNLNSGSENLEDGDNLENIFEDESDELGLSDDFEDTDAKVQSMLNKILNQIYQPNAVNENINISNIEINKKEKNINNGSFKNASSKNDNKKEKILEVIKEKQKLEEEILREEKNELEEQIKNETKELVAEEKLQKAKNESRKEKKKSAVPKTDESKNLDKKVRVLTLKEEQAKARRIGEKLRREFQEKLAKEKLANKKESKKVSINETKKVILKKEEISDKKTKVIKSEKLVKIGNKSSININNFENEFKKEKSEKYTLSILTLSKKREVKTVKNIFNLEKDMYIYKLENEAKSYYKVLYGIYDNKEEARKDIKNLHKTLRNNGVSVNLISEHQKLIKKYNKNRIINQKPIKEKSIEKKSTDEKLTEPISPKSFNEKNNSFEQEFKTKASNKYTLAIMTLSTYKKPTFIKKQYNLKNNIIVYKSQNKNKNYYKVLHGMYDSSKEAKKDIKNLHKELRNNGVFVNKISKHQKLFKKYNSNGGK